MDNKDSSSCLKKSSKGTILLIGKKIGTVLAKRLASHNYNIILAENGFEALETLRAHYADLIICTLHLPRMDCLELLMNLKDLQVRSPIVILDDSRKEHRGKSLSIADIWGYCYMPPVISKMNEVISCIKQSGQ